MRLIIFTVQLPDTDLGDLNIAVMLLQVQCISTCILSFFMESIVPSYEEFVIKA